MMTTITPIYASVLALFFVLLSVQTIRQRRFSKTAIGFGSSPELLRAVRVHANFAEYVPIALILLLLLEMNGAAIWVIHGLGLILVTGRCIHAYGVSRVDENFKWRVTGIAMTLTCIIVAAAYNLFLQF